MNVKAISSTSSSLKMWVIYDKPTDFPESYVMREWMIADGQLIAGPARTGKTIEEVRAYVPPYARTLMRTPSDDPCIVETWI